MREDNKKKLLKTALEMASGPLRVMPLWMEVAAIGVFIDSVLKKHPSLALRLADLDGKLFLFEATDLKKSFFLKIDKERVRVIVHLKAKPDVIMKGKFKVLADLMLGEEDADTVFFSRKLQISGETATALHLKNILSSF